MVQSSLAKKTKNTTNKKLINKTKSNSNKSSSHGLGPKKGGSSFFFISWFI